MAIGSTTVEVIASVDPKRLWMAFAKDSTNFLPKALPNIYSSASIIEGDGGVGSIKKFNFTDANKDLWYDKERVEELNEKELLYRYSTLGKGVLMDEKLKSGKFEMKFNPIKFDDGDECLLVWTSDFETFSESPPSEAKIQELRAEVVAMVKMVESYLLSNPQMYN
ncbi:hypothetical protein SUGI_0091280 [Cryptomeria japonica]|nr:hypothetical protein SUGI_0091280 [Cryptomeria japonica]